MAHDPLVALWERAARPLNWRPWHGLCETALARLRATLIAELASLDQEPGNGWPWRHAHRELLDIKAATGHRRGENEP